MQAFPNGDRYYGQQQPAGYYQQFPSYGYPQPAPQQPIAAPFPLYPPHYEQMPPSTPHLQPGRPRPLALGHEAYQDPRPPSTLGSFALFEGDGQSLSDAREPAQALGCAPIPSHVSNPVRDFAGAVVVRSSHIHLDHLILTLRSTNQLVVDNLTNHQMGDELSEEVLPIWPRGANSIENRRGKWQIEFAGTPWSCSGLDAIMAAKMICRLYLVLARQGYTYLSTINVGNPWKPPSMVFVDTTPDYEALVFLIMLSKRGDRLTIIDGPPELTQQLGIELRRNFPRRITTDRATEDGLHIFEVKKGSYGMPTVDKSMLIAFVLHFFNSANFRLSGSIPMGSRNPFNFGHRKEMWVFKSLPWRPGTREELRPESRQSRNTP
ncbi:hypothetical protein ONZ51_g2722 [Trametes cubensis]|uniref:Uncharacterized protein n=1 Tax=Trametes cubensis TaxID=1111947 RepID=A0AAD7TZN9_9APHY|nr:hypothetical protein ONZ51_g2722 [Trametes cubensis]